MSDTKLFALPLMGAYRVPIEEDGKGAKRTTREKMLEEGRASDIYITADRFEAMAYL